MLTLPAGLQKSILPDLFISGSPFHARILKGDCVVNLRREWLAIRVSWNSCQKMQGNIPPGTLTYLEILYNKILTAFSTLRTLDAGRPARDAGVHLDKVKTIQLANAGRSFTRFPMLFSIAERRSTLFAMKRKSPKPWANNVIMPSSNFIPSASSAWTRMNGWSGGQRDRFGSFLFWSCARNENV